MTPEPTAATFRVACFREGLMRKLCHGVFIIALATASGAAWGQQSQSPSSVPSDTSTAPAAATPPAAAPSPAAPPPAAATPPAAAPPATAQAAAKPAQLTAPAGAYSYIVNLHNGETVISPFKVVFGLSSNMGVAPAGTEKPNVGHHHLLIDTTLKPEDMTQPIPVDEHHVHFGKGQTETALTLPPGKHTLQLVLADWSHIPFNPSVQSAVITVKVKAPVTAKASVKAKRAALVKRRQ